MLVRLARQGASPRNIADIGTGTGLLAFAAMALWPRAKVIASDIDPASIFVTRDNAAINHVPLGRGGGRLALAVAPGRSEEHTSELQSLMRISYAVFCLKNNK